MPPISWVSGLQPPHNVPYILRVRFQRLKKIWLLSAAFMREGGVAPGTILLYCHVSGCTWNNLLFTTNPPLPYRWNPLCLPNTFSSIISFEPQNPPDTSKSDLVIPIFQRRKLKCKKGGP